jgi:hypothetical protein
VRECEGVWPPLRVRPLVLWTLSSRRGAKWGGSSPTAPDAEGEWPLLAPAVAERSTEPMMRGSITSRGDERSDFDGLAEVGEAKLGFRECWMFPWTTEAWRWWP